MYLSNNDLRLLKKYEWLKPYESYFFHENKQLGNLGGNKQINYNIIDKWITWNLL